MKIGVLTFHRAHNYGAVLQCYALTSYLSSMGHEVKVIDYYPSYFKEEYSSSMFKTKRHRTLRNSISLIINDLFKHSRLIKRQKKFDDFINSLPLSDTVDEYSVNYLGYDVIFVGSDQVWNIKLTQGIDAAFTGQLNHASCVLASYAASTELIKGISEIDNYYRDIISNFDFISTREKQFNNYLNSLMPNVSVNVVDPVLLLDKEQWEKLAILPKEKHYLLIYTVPRDPKVFELAKLIAQRNGLKIIELVSKIRYFYKPHTNQTASPREFLGFFLNADYIVTTSFHGTAFSIRLEKQFSTVLLGRSVDERANDLLNRLGLSNRAVRDIALPDNEIDYSKLSPIVERVVNESKLFIDKVLSNSSK